MGYIQQEAAPTMTWAAPQVISEPVVQYVENRVVSPAYAPTSPVVVSGRDRSPRRIVERPTYAPTSPLQGSRVILTNDDVSPRRIVERDLSPNRTITLPRYS